MDQKTVDVYNELAEAYDQETTDFWIGFPSSILDTFAQEVESSVLNIGSGPGRDAILLKERGLDITCLDASESMVQITKAKGLKAVLSDFMNLPFSENSFDGVWAYTSLLHVPKSQISVALSEIRRVLKPNGIFGLGLIEGSGEEYKRSSGMASERLFSFYTKNEVEKLLTKFDFENFYFETFKPGSKNYLNFISRKH